jgi:hypothetical protein
MNKKVEKVEKIAGGGEKLAPLDGAIERKRRACDFFLPIY